MGSVRRERWHRSRGPIPERRWQNTDRTFSQPATGALFFVRKPELQGMRRFPVSDGFDKIVPFYFPLRDGVDLVRVVHGSRDLERLLLKRFFG